MKKIIFVLMFISAGLMTTADATRPLRKSFPVRQSDGTTLMVYRQGNGHFGFYTTTDGIALLRNANGDLCYAEKTDNGLKATSMAAHEADKRGKEENAFLTTRALSAGKAYTHLQQIHLADKPKRASRLAAGSDGLGVYGQPNPDGVVNSIGDHTIPVIMVEFSDRKFMSGTTPEKVSRMLNEKGYADETGCAGSVNDYFVSQSNGLFNPKFEIVAKVTASRGYAYYGENYSNGDIDRNVSKLIQEALNLAKAQGVDFSKYKEGNAVPLVSIYYAGPGEHSAFEDEAEDYLWAHFSERSYMVGNVRINSYFIGNEVMQSYDYDKNWDIIVTGAQFDGMGVFVHEFGHALGLPDFYYTGSDDDINNSIQTMDYWSVMDYGQYYYDGYAPIGYNAYERNSMGWLKIEELTAAGYITLYPFGSEARGMTACLIRNDANPKEYYILENRQPSTWYPSRMGHGMLITHVDFDATSWNYNRPNNIPDHQRFQYVPADNKKNVMSDNGTTDWNGFKGDLFPGTTGITEFSDESTPASSVFTGARLGKPLYNLKEQNGIIAFSYLDKSLTGIGAVPDATAGTPVEIYTIDGRKTSSVPASGVYIIRQDGKNRKVILK